INILHVKAPATTHLSSLSLHDALPILADREHTECARDDMSERADPERAASRAKQIERSARHPGERDAGPRDPEHRWRDRLVRGEDRKSTRLNSSHLVISYAVFCLKKKK